MEHFKITSSDAGCAVTTCGNSRWLLFWVLKKKKKKDSKVRRLGKQDRNRSNRAQPAMALTELQLPLQSWAGENQQCLSPTVLPLLCPLRERQIPVMQPSSVLACEGSDSLTFCPSSTSASSNWTHALILCLGEKNLVASSGDLYLLRYMLHPKLGW